LNSRILINGRFLTRPMTGVDRFAFEVLRLWLPRYGQSHAAEIIVPPVAPINEIYASLPSPTRVGSLRGHAWEQLELPIHAREATLVNLCSTGPILRESQLCVLHDAAVMSNPQTFSFAFRTWYRYLFAGLMRRARTIATVSRFSADELTRFFGRRKAALEVVYCSGEHILREPPDSSILQRLDLVGRRYVLAVGSRSRNKNFAAAVAAVAQLGDPSIKLVAAGGSNQRVFAGIELHSDNLVPAGYVSDPELRALYEGAECFIFPSFYEGFGLPPLEAMHCGCPVIVSGRTSLPEVCADAALYCNPDDVGDIVRRLKRLLGSEALRAEMRERGLIRARDFSWQVSADRLEALLVR
jgi:glycosyltransferase involved in cell wall biosynthesis